MFCGRPIVFTIHLSLSDTSPSHPHTTPLPKSDFFGFTCKTTEAGIEKKNRWTYATGVRWQLESNIFINFWN